MLLAYFLVVLAAWLLYRFKLKGLFSYWSLRGVPGPKGSAPFGHFSDVFLGRKSNIDFITDLYYQYKNEKYIGTQFGLTPLLHIHDTEIIRQVFIKEFHDFNGRGTYDGTDDDFLASHLISMSGTPWRNMRVKLSPTFSTGKIKYMFNTIKECGAQLHQHVSTRMEAGSGIYNADIKELSARYSIDIITTAAFGVTSNCIENDDSEFRKIGHLLFDPTVKLGIKNVAAFFCPGLFRATGMHFFDKHVENFICKAVWDMVEYREKNGVERADMLNLFIKLKNEGYIPPDSGDKVESSNGDADSQTRQKMTLKEIAAQCLLFFAAGFETSASTALFALYLLAKNRHTHEKAIEDIEASLNRHGGKVSYDMVTDLPYLDKVIYETLRFYPSVPFLTRAAMRERNLPTTDVVLEKGQRLIIPVLGLHLDPKFWENPMEFDPERFSKENEATRPPMVYLPFGDGPRICIGMRLAMVQVKMALLSFLSQADVHLAPNTPEEMVVSPLSFTPTPDKELLLELRAKDRGWGNIYE